MGSELLLDSSSAEQQCASCVLGVAVDREGACCGVQYLKHGLLAAADLSAVIEVRSGSNASYSAHVVIVA